MAGAPPLYGTWRRSTPARALKSSPERCATPPAPEDAKLSVPGFALASAISSCTFFAGTAALATSTTGMSATMLTGARSFFAS